MTMTGDATLMRALQCIEAPRPLRSASVHAELAPPPLSVYPGSCQIAYSTSSMKMWFWLTG
jgi:hypothetical protein